MTAPEIVIAVRVSPTLAHDIWQALSAEPESPRVIHDRIGYGAFNTTRHVLNTLAKRGDVQRTYQDHRRFGRVSLFARKATTP